MLVDGLVEHSALAREVARAAYDAGARFVDVRYADLHVRRAMVERAPEETLQLTPPWMVDRLEWANAEGAAQIDPCQLPRAGALRGPRPAAPRTGTAGRLPEGAHAERLDEGAELDAARPSERGVGEAGVR